MPLYTSCDRTRGSRRQHGPQQLWTEPTLPSPEPRGRARCMRRGLGHAPPYGLVAAEVEIHDRSSDALGVQVS